MERGNTMNKIHETICRTCDAHRSQVLDSWKNKSITLDGVYDLNELTIITMQHRGAPCDISGCKKPATWFLNGSITTKAAASEYMRFQRAAGEINKVTQ